MSRNKYKNNTAQNKTQTTLPGSEKPEEGITGNNLSQIPDPGIEIPDPIPVAEDVYQTEIHTGTEEEPEPLVQYMDPKTEKPFMDAGVSDGLSAPDFREHQQIPAGVTAPMQSAGRDEEGGRITVAYEKPVVRKNRSFPWWWILLPLILLGLLYGLTRPKTPPVDPPANTDSATTSALVSPETKSADLLFSTLSTEMKEYILS